MCYADRIAIRRQLVQAILALKQTPSAALQDHIDRLRASLKHQVDAQ